MSEELKIFIIFLIGIFSTYFGSFSSGGTSVLGIGLMTLLGIPPQMASITYKLGKLGDILGELHVFHKHGHIPWRFFWGASIFSIIGSFLGSYFVFSLASSTIYFFSGISMLILAGVSFVKNLRKNPHIEYEEVSKSREWAYRIVLLFLTFFGNIFIAGSGVYYYFANTLILRLSPLRAKGNAVAVSLSWFIGTFLGILAQGNYIISWGIALGFGMLIGSYLGTKHIIKLGNRKLGNILLCTIVLFALYFLYLSFHV